MTVTLSSLAAVAATLSLAALPAMAQTASAPTLQPVAYSSSITNQNLFAGEDIDGSSLTSAPDGKRNIVEPQFGGGGGNGGYHRYNDNGGFSHLALEAGGGFTAPTGSAASSGGSSLIGDGQQYGIITWGGNFLVGAGWNFSKRFTLLGEFQYDSNKIPGRTLNAVYNTNFSSTSGITVLHGSVHTLSVTAEPMYYFYRSDKSKYSAYVIGGGGYYHKSTNFTTPVQSYGNGYYGGGIVNAPVASFADSALGGNIGAGATFNPLGEYSHLKLFAEARYVYVDTPGPNLSSATGNSHTGSEALIPVTFGIRF